MNGIDMKNRISAIVLKLLGVLLLAGASLKGHELLTIPMANNDLWSYRPFIIFQVEFELILGIWLLSGLWKRTAWGMTALCFFIFSCVTAYKGLAGADSCGCFGQIHVNPWITLFCIDLPCLLALIAFPPQNTKKMLASTIHQLLLFIRARLSKEASQRSVQAAAALNTLKTSFQPFYPRRSLAVGSLTGIIVMSSLTALSLFEPQKVTASYEVLEPETWKDKKLPILENINVADTLEQGNWLLLLYHYDCPDCAKVIPEYQRIARDLAGNEEFLRVAFVEVPPFDQTDSQKQFPGLVGKMDSSKEWFVTTPAVALLTNGIVRSAWEGQAPGFDTILEQVAVTMQ